MTLTWKAIRALCSGNGDDRRWLAVVDYLVAENRVLQELLSASGRQQRLADQQRLCLAVLGRQLKPGLRGYIRIVTPGTLMRSTGDWSRRATIRRRSQVAEWDDRRPRMCSSS